MATKPDPARWRELRRYAISHDLTSRTADAYATLMHWGEQLGRQPSMILSGKRSAAHNRELQRQWDAGNRAGLKVRPANSSAHLRGEAFDIANNGALDLYGRLASYAGMRWGGTFRDRDPNHFDMGAE